MRDLIEILESSAEQRYKEMDQGDGMLKCSCGTIFDPRKEGGFICKICFYLYNRGKEKIMLKKCVSGCQIGADVAGLIVAKEYGLETGGWMPKGFITQSGPHPDWAGQYGLQEHTSPKYPPRTFANVRDSDGTIRFAFNFNSAGERCTMKAIQQYKKPHIDVNLNEQFVKVDAVAEWIERFSIETLNIAGNSERTYSGITGEVMEFLGKLFEKLGFEKVNHENT